MGEKVEIGSEKGALIEGHKNKMEKLKSELNKLKNEDQ
jgi:hypothetical protein